ncbi:MAG: ELWxxDGT repeat protein [Bacteroidia bacterium]
MKKIYSLIIYILLSASTFAQTPVLVKDIYSGNAGSYLGRQFIYNNVMLFTAESVDGEELWTTDGTTANTFMVKDIYPGANSSNIKFFNPVNGILYFTANDGAHGYELWRTDGTNAGTYMVKDIIPGSVGSFDNLIFFYVVWQHNGYFYFEAAGSIATDVELWKSDGTATGTQLVKDIYPGTATSDADDFIEFNNELLFRANNGTDGIELWKTDGTTIGTVEVKDIRPGIADGLDATHLFKAWEHNGYFYFLAETNDVGDRELWKTDGTTTGTQLVKDICIGSVSSDARGFSEFNNELFFSATDGVNGKELWKTDGTTTGTVNVKNILAGNVGGFDYSPLYIVWQHNGFFYFVPESTSNYERELWKSDGTTAGTQLIKDICPGVGSAEVYNFFEFNNELFFKANDCTNGNELWKTDGTTTGTVMVKNILAGVDGGLDNVTLYKVWEHNGFFYFVANTNGISDKELWKSDGTTAGTQVVKDIWPGANESNPLYFYEFNSELFFSANNGNCGPELWKSNGTNAGTTLVEDILPGNAGSFSSSGFIPFIHYNGYLFFIAGTADVGDKEIWKTDGTATGTTLVQDIYPGITGSNPTSFRLLANDYLVFRATDPTHGDELWSFYMPGISAIEEHAVNSISVYPNPVTDILNINAKDNKIESFKIHNSIGKLILDKTVNQQNFQIDISQFNSGIYFIQVQTKDGMLSAKIIKQ